MSTRKDSSKSFKLGLSYGLAGVIVTQIFLTTSLPCTTVPAGTVVQS